MTRRRPGRPGDGAARGRGTRVAAHTVTTTSALPASCTAVGRSPSTTIPDATDSTGCTSSNDAVVPGARPADPRLISTHATTCPARASSTSHAQDAAGRDTEIPVVAAPTTPVVTAAAAVATHTGVTTCAGLRRAPSRLRWR